MSSRQNNRVHKSLKSAIIQPKTPWEAMTYPFRADFRVLVQPVEAGFVFFYKAQPGVHAYFVITGCMLVPMQTQDCIQI